MNHDFWITSNLKKVSVFDPYFGKPDNKRAIKPCFASCGGIFGYDKVTAIPPSQLYRIVYITTHAKSREWIADFNSIFSKTMHIHSFKQDGPLTDWETRELANQKNDDKNGQYERTALCLTLKGNRTESMADLEYMLIPLLQFPRGFSEPYHFRSVYRADPTVEGTFSAWYEAISDCEIEYGKWSNAMNFTFEDFMLLADPDFIKSMLQSASFRELNKLYKNPSAYSFPRGTQLCEVILAVKGAK